MRFLFAGALLALVAAAAAAGSPPARLALVQASPVTIAGAGFQSGHAVTVSYVSGAQHGRRVVRASAQGGVRVVFQTLAFDRCRGATVRAGAAPLLLVLPCSTPGGKPTIGGTLGGFVRGSAFVPEEHVTVTGRASGSGPVTRNLAAATDG